MRAHLRYLSYVLRHKWFVLVAGLRVGAPLWRLLIHDASKFRPSEWFPYVAFFYGSAPSLNPAYHGPREREEEAAAWKARAKAAFDRAWLHHQHRNAHHWQRWLLMEDAPARYPRWHITSPDGGMRWHGLTEYSGPMDKRGEQPHVTADLGEGLACDGDPAKQERYLMVKRCTDAANARRPVALPMPEPLIREMVADWMGAGRAIAGKWEAAAWYRKNRDNMVLHPATRARVEALLAEYGGATDATPPTPSGGTHAG